MDNNLIISQLKSIYEKEELLGKLAFKGKYENYGISEIHCVYAIGNIKDPNVTKIAYNMNMTRGAISKICKKLLEKKVIDKYKKIENDKEIYFNLTEAGKEMYVYHEIKHKQWEERNNKFFESVNIEEQEIVSDFLGKFNDYLNYLIENERTV